LNIIANFVTTLSREEEVANVSFGGKTFGAKTLTNPILDFEKVTALQRRAQEQDSPGGI
jgi:hypothetical protein